MEKIRIAQNINLVNDAPGYLENTLTGDNVPLTKTEYETILVLTQSPGASFTRQDLAKKFWSANGVKEKEENNPGYDIRSSVDGRILRARKKLNKVSPGLGGRIKTITTYADTFFKFESDIVLPKEEGFSLPDVKAVDPNSVQAMEFWQLVNLTIPGTDQKYDAKKVALFLKRNDYKLFPGLMHSPELAGDYGNMWAKHLSKRPESFKYLVAGNNDIVGNFSFVALNHEQGKACVAGEFLEESFDISQSEPLSTAGMKDILYILNFSINDEYATPRNRNLLKQLFFKTLQTYAEYDSYFRHIYINIFEPAQAEEFKKWGFVKLDKRRNVHYGELYALDLIPYPDSLFTALSKNSMLKDINFRLKELYDGISTTFD